MDQINEQKLGWCDMAIALRRELKRTPPAPAGIDPRALARAITDAVNSACTCGGRGPHDPGVCPACEVYHALRENPLTAEALA